MAKKRVLIIGGGLSGLAAAWSLAKGTSDVEITLLEGAPETGGLARGFPICGTNIEKAYHHIFRTDTEILNLLEELGLEDSVIWGDSSTGVYLEGEVFPFTTPFDLLRFKPLNLLGRIRLGLVTLYLKYTRKWRALADQPAYLWMKKACGTTVAEKSGFLCSGVNSTDILNLSPWPGFGRAFIRARIRAVQVA
jgi:protoporphyrinogen oxidase